MTLYERWNQAGQKLWDTGDGTELVEFFKKLATLHEAEQRDFFLEVAAHHNDAMRATVEDGIAFATDFYPRMNSSSFPNFEHLVNKSQELLATLNELYGKFGEDAERLSRIGPNRKLIAAIDAVYTEAFDIDAEWSEDVLERFVTACRALNALMEIIEE